MDELTIWIFRKKHDNVIKKCQSIFIKKSSLRWLPLSFHFISFSVHLPNYVKHVFININGIRWIGQCECSERVCVCLAFIDRISQYVWTSFYMSLLITLAAQLKMRRKKTHITIYFTDSRSSSSSNSSSTYLAAIPAVMTESCVGCVRMIIMLVRIMFVVCVRMYFWNRNLKSPKLSTFWALDHFVGSDYYLTY